MTSHLANLLDAARHAYFVGRAEELRGFRKMLDAVCLPFCGLYICGPGGVGKTALLGEFARICQAVGVGVAYVDGRHIEPAPASLLRAVGAAMGLPGTTSPLTVLAATRDRYVLFIDTYEMLAPLDGWLRQTFLPQLSHNVLVVLAGREAPSEAWRGDPGWQVLIHALALRNLNPDESRAYLARRGVPAAEHSAILEFTYGHPLALSLIADASAQHPGWRFEPQATPDLIRALLERLVDKVPSALHRVALEACALARVTTEGLLAAMLAMADAHDLFEWLRGLSFMQGSQEGLFPHDEVRQVLATDLRWRNPEWHAELHRRARDYYTQRVKETRGQVQQRFVMDYIYLHRDSPVVRPFFEWQIGGHTCGELARPEDAAAVTALVAHYEGDASAQQVRRWFGHAAASTIVYRDPDAEVAGFVMMLDLAHVAPEDAEADPATGAALRYLAGRLRSGTGTPATLFRFWMARDTYQSVSTIQSLIFVNAVQHYLTTPGLVFTLFPCAEPDFWAPVFGYADLTHIAAADFELDGRRYGVFGHDWHSVPPTDWLNLLAEREILGDLPSQPPPPRDATQLVLSQPDFAVAVHQALHDAHRPDLLRSNPLLRSRLVARHTGARADETERLAALQSLLHDAAEALLATPRDVKLHRAVYHTYFQPAPTQEQAAELLDIPFSTFRRHLTAGVQRITEALWLLEVG